MTIVYLQMQAFHLAIVDEFITRLEYGALEKLLIEESTPVPEAIFLLAQSQMWIFAIYEVMRTWRQRCKSMIVWAENGGLEAKLKSLEKEVGYQHFGHLSRANQIKRVIADPSLVPKIEDDLRLTHIPFGRLEAIRISIAKHEVGGRRNSVALRPGYGRINNWTGSLDFELENGFYSMGFISRRDIADEIRALPTQTAPTKETIAEFDAYMRGSAAPPFSVDTVDDEPDESGPAPSN
jgi:hypothetical protein